MSSILHDFEKQLETLTRAEKAQILQWVVRDLGDAFPGIESRPGVCGGEPCIVRTRIPVWVLEQSRRLGISEAELLRSYPSLRRGSHQRLGFRSRSPLRDRSPDPRQRGGVRSPRGSTPTRTFRFPWSKSCVDLGTTY